MESLAVASVEEGEVVLEIDPAATLRIYEKQATGGADDCHCLPCGHYGSQRTLGFTKDLFELLARLGVDPRKESEAVYCGSSIYSVRFPFVGRFATGFKHRGVVLAGPDGKPTGGNAPRTVLTGDHPMYARFGRNPVLQVEIEVKFPTPPPVPTRTPKAAEPDED
jgi:hypothetical protein